MSASCSIDPDSRRSDSIGLCSLRCSAALDSCDSAITGMSSSFANIFSERLISEISCSRLPIFLFPEPCINCK